MKSLRKTISKMKQTHAEEVEELNAKIDELEKAASEREFNLQRVAAVRNDYSDELDDARAAFAQMALLAGMAENLAEAILKITSKIKADAEEWI